METEISRTLLPRLLACLSLLSMLLTSCDVTKYVPDNAYLLDHATVGGELETVSASELEGYVRQQPNARIFHLWRVGLGVYSISGRKETGFNEWLRRIGSEPVVYDSTLTVRSVEQLKRCLDSKGYYDAVVSDTMVVSGKKRCNVTYRVKAGRVHRISSIGYQVPEGEVGELVLADTVNSLLKAGDPFDSNVHDMERSRIVRMLQDHGYYSFGKDYIYFIADSTVGDHLVRDSLVVVNALGGADKRTQVPHRKAMVDGVELIVLDSDVDRRNVSDSVPMRAKDLVPGVSVRYADNLIFADHILRNSCYIKPGEIYSLTDVELTQQRFNSLKPLRQASFRFFETGDPSTQDDTVSHVHCVGFLQTKKTQTIGVDVEGTNSSGNLGAAGNIRYTHSNIFHGAEALSVKTRIATQNQTATDGKDNFFTMELGVETSITFPFLLFPYSTQHFYRTHNPQSVVSASFDWQHRPEFTRSVIATKLSYNWRGSKYAQHVLTPVELNVVRIPSISDNFRSYIEGTYLQYSYTDHFIMSLSYGFLFNQQRVRNNSSGWYYRFDIETAGNVVNLLTRNKGTDSEDFKRVWGIRFSQYVKTSSEVRYQMTDLHGNATVVRFFGGIGIPYGNSVMLPFEKSFFVGGANSLRAWPVRGLGPGSQVSDPGLRYHNQTSDIRLEANLEYRFKMVSVFEGAVFGDAGNIWALNRSHNAPEAVFTKDFYKQIALGAGLGIRLNFDYFILRVDAAYKLHDPSDEEPWVVKKRFSDSNIAWNFAIGYPF